MNVDLFPLEDDMLWFSFSSPDGADMYPVQIISAGRLSTESTAYRISSAMMRQYNPLKYHSLQYSIKGTGRVAYFDNGNKIEREVPPGHLFLMSHDLEYEFWFPGGEKWEWFFVVLEGELADRVFHDFESRHRIFEISPDSEPIQCIRNMIAMALAHNLDQYKIQLVGCELLISLKKTEAVSKLTEKEKFCQEMELYIREHIEDINIEKMAKYRGFSTKYFQKYFHRLTGMTPGAFILKQRISYAKMLIESSAMKLSAVASMTGFSDASHLCKTFKTHYNMTPDSLRRRI